jgi:hypothetical protein
MMPHIFIFFIHLLYVLQRHNKNLATITLESEVLENIDYKDIIEGFISKNTKE